MNPDFLEKKELETLQGLVEKNDKSSKEEETLRKLKYKATYGEEGMDKMKLFKDKSRASLDFIFENLYMGKEDFHVGEEKFNSALLFGMMTAVNRGKELVFGEYGLGKTTSAERILSLMYGLPEEVVLAGELKGHAEQTEEKIIGRPDLGKLNAGFEDTVWTYFVHNHPKIIDEINRLPPSKQNIILEGVDRGNFKYMNELVVTGDFPLFATNNYKDVGNADLSAPLCDRFDVAVESKHPGVNNTRLIRLLGIEEILKDMDVAEEFFGILDAKTYGDLKSDDDPVDEKADKKKLGYKAKRAMIEDLSSKYTETLEGRMKSVIEDNGGDVEKFPGLLKADEREEFYAMIKDMPVDDKATLFLDLMETELTGCSQYGQKRSNEPCVNADCHFKDLMCRSVEGCMSVRTDLGVMKYAKTLAAMLGDEEVTTEHVEKVFPYATWHRTQLTEEFVDKFKSDERDDPMPLYAMKKAVGEMKKRWTDQANTIETLASYMREEKYDDARKLVEDAKRSHPIFKEYLCGYEDE